MKEYLALGSIVLLKKGNKKLMIYGRCQINGNTGEIYDYVGCFYPEGNVSGDFTFLFNNEDVEEVIFEGYKDEEEEKFIELINKEINDD